MLPVNGLACSGQAVKVMHRIQPPTQRDSSNPPGQSPCMRRRDEGQGADTSSHVAQDNLSLDRQRDSRPRMACERPGTCGPIRHGI